MKFREAFENFIASKYVCTWCFSSFNCLPDNTNA